MKRITNIPTIFVMIIVAILTSSNYSESEEDPFINNVVYSQNGYENVILVEDGRDNATFFKYLIIDDYSEAPENWSETNFNDSSWAFGAAPFGDRQYNGVDPNTDWDTNGNDDDIILIRHNFYLHETIVTSAEFDAAFANYCTPYLNGNLIYEERGGNAHGAEYWNDDGNEDVPADMFNEGKNVLAVYGRDYVYGSSNQNRQWLDVQLKATVFENTTEPIILGDTITVLINGGNKGNLSATNVTINATSNETIVNSFQYTSMPANTSGNIWAQWTPQSIGYNTLLIEISCECNDENLSNNLILLNITAQIYSLQTQISNETLIINQTRTVNKTFQIKNTGDLVDIVTLTNDQPSLNGWSIEFIPNNFVLEPNASQNVTITAQIPSEYDDGYYNLSFTVESEYNYLITQTILESGATGDTNWKWINSTNEEELYSDDNWTKLNFDDNDWKNGSTPFGDSNSETAFDYKTFWDGDNYAYFRHTLDIPDIGLYENGFIKLNVATNNYGNHYINGIYIFGDIDGGGGHGAEYWNEEYQTYINYLNQGKNVISSMVYNPQNSQWFDQEIILSFPQANLWNYKTLSYNIPLYLDSTAPVTEVIEEGFYRNNSLFEIKWRDLSNSEDLLGYNIYYLEKEGNNIGNWIKLGFFTNNSFNFKGENGKTYRFKSISQDIVGNLEYKTTYDTEMKIDSITPSSEMRIVGGNIRYTNFPGITLTWKPNNTNDIETYKIEYKFSNETNWSLIETYNSIENYRFSPILDGTYYIRSISKDYAGNLEIKENEDLIITFDRIKPELKLKHVNSLTGLEGLLLEIEYKSENLSNLQVQYARLLENEENRLEWTNIDVVWENEQLLLTNLADGYSYYFRVSPIDLANNTNPRNPYEFTIKWTNQSNNVSLINYPLKPVMSLNPFGNMKICVDENFDEAFETCLQEYMGNDLNFMKPNQYWIDYKKPEVIFGTDNYGYKPPNNTSIKFSYEAYDAYTTIDTKPPNFVRKPTYSIEEENNITIEWKNVDDATEYIIEYRKDLSSSSWSILDEIASNNENEMEYKIENLESGFHYYRIISVDRMGYQNDNMEDELLEVFIVSEVNTVVTNDIDDDSGIDPKLIGALAIMMIGGLGLSIYMNKKGSEDLVEPLLVPLEEAKEDLAEIEDANLEKTFTILSGSEYSRDIIFICDNGCQEEFPAENDDDDEVMCPHCGMMGESPL